MNTTLDIKEISAIAANVLRDMAIAELDRQLDLYRDAQRIYEASIGSMREQVSIEQGLRINAEYETTKRAYAALGLTNLGIHRI